MNVAGLERNLDGVCDLLGLGLPGTETNGGDLGTRVEGESATDFGQCDEEVLKKGLCLTLFALCQPL